MGYEQGFRSNQELNNENIVCEPTESEKCEKRTKELKRGHSKTVNKLTKIAQEAGFKKLFINPHYASGDIYVDPDTDKEAVFFLKMVWKIMNYLKKLIVNLRKKALC